MKFALHFSVDIPDKLARQLLDTAGPSIDHPIDQILALSVLAMRPIPGTLRNFLLATDHHPVEPFTPTLLTTDNSNIAVTMTIHPGDDPCPAPSPSRSSRKSRTTTKPSLSPRRTESLEKPRPTMKRRIKRSKP